MIIILTQANDPHADRVEELLGQRGADFARFNPALFPTQAGISLSGSTAENLRAELQWDGRTIDLEAVEAVWYRRPEFPAADPRITDPRTRALVEGECYAVLSDLWQTLEARWLPGRPEAVQQAQNHAPQLKLARGLGFEIPPTLITNRKADVLEFYRRHGGNVVSQLARFSWFETVGRDFCRYTEVVSQRDLGYAHSIRYCPMIFQAYVPKRVELRVTVVGSQVFAAEIRSQETNHTRHDWRRYDQFKTPYVPHELPDELADRCVRLVECLGLSFGAIDLIQTPDGRCVFLEINPNGQYLWVEQAARLPISEAICDLLCEPRAASTGAEVQVKRPFQMGACHAS